MPSANSTTAPCSPLSTLIPLGYPVREFGEKTDFNSVGSHLHPVVATANREVHPELFDLLKINSGRIHAPAGILNNEGVLDENAGTAGICLFLFFRKTNKYFQSPSISQHQSEILNLLLPFMSFVLNLLLWPSTFALRPSTFDFRRLTFAFDLRPSTFNVSTCSPDVHRSTLFPSYHSCYRC